MARKNVFNYEFRRRPVRKRVRELDIKYNSIASKLLLDCGKVMPKDWLLVVAERRGGVCMYHSKTVVIPAILDRIKDTES